MSFPTPNDSFIREFKQKFDLVERDFLDPKKLYSHLLNIEKLIERDYLVITSKDSSLELSSDQKQTIKDLLKKIETKFKQSKEKINWSNDFSGFLQNQTGTK